jgi:hypothetical protein
VDRWVRQIPTSEFHAQDTLHLAKDLGIGDSLAGLVILEYGGFLVDLLSEVLLRQLEIHSGLLHRLSNVLKIAGR